MQNFTHFDTSGNAIMVDVSTKPETQRTAIASGQIVMSAKAFTACKLGNSKKGDVLSVARIAGIMATKQTPNLIPLCHTISIEKATIEFELLDETNAVLATCTVKCNGKTGVEMEALTGVSIALLTIYDMCKALDKEMKIGNIALVKKTGGKR